MDNLPFSVLRKRMSIVLMACAVTGGLVACGSEDGDSANAQGQPSEITVLFLSSSAYDPCSEEYAAKFSEETGIKVNVLSEGFPPYHDKLMTTFAGGAATYDVVMYMYQWTGEFGGGGFLEPLNERMEASADELSDVIPSVNELYVYDGKQYAIPFTAQSETLFYRTDLLEAEGFDPPKTWDEFMEIAEFFTDNPDYPGMTGTSVKGATQHVQTDFDNRYFGLGGDVLGTPGSTMDPEIATEALALLKKASVELSPAGALVATPTELGAQFQAGDVAMVEMMPSTILPVLTDESDASKVAGKVGVSAVPGGKGESGGWALGIPVASEKKDAAFDFIKYMISPEADLACYLDYGKSAVRSGSYSDPALKDTFYAAGVLESLEGGVGAPSGVTAPKITTMVNDIVSRFLAGQIATAEEAGQQMAEQYSEIIADE